MRGEQMLVPCRGILAAAKQEACSGFLGCEERVLGEFPGQPLAHRPANHRARVKVEEHGQIQPALGRPDICDIPGPDPIGLRHGELAIEDILGHGQVVIRLGHRAPLPHFLGPKASLAHQPGHAMLANAVVLFDQGIPDAEAAIGLAELSMDEPDG